MSSIRQSLLVGVYVAAVYLLGAFVAWDADPGNWTAEGRSFAGFAMACIVVGCLVIFNKDSRP